jgi:hypothetical protein
MGFGGWLLISALLLAGAGLLGWAGLRGAEVFIRIGERQLGRTARLRAGEH